MIPSQFVIPIYDADGSVIGYNTRESLFIWLNDVVGKLSEANTDFMVIRKSDYWDSFSDEKKNEIKFSFTAKLTEQKTQIEAILSEIETI